MQHIFLSYSRKDSEMMRTIATYLLAEHFNVWTDESLTPGTRSWKHSIEKAIEAADVLVAILSPDAKESEWVDRELEYARIRGKRIFALLARGDAISSVPFELVNSQWIDISNDENYSPGMERLTLVLDKHLGIKRKSKSELIHDELIHLADKLPEIYWIGLFSIDGLTVAFDTTALDFSPNEDRAAAMSASTLALGQRITDELDAGELRYNVIGGSKGFQVGVSLDRYVLWFGLRHAVSLDAIFITLRQWWKPLLILLDIDEPPKI